MFSVLCSVCRSLFVLFILVILVCSSSFLQLLNTPLISSNFLPSNIGLARKEKSQKNYGLLYPWGDKILFSLNSLVLLEIYSDIFKLSPWVRGMVSVITALAAVLRFCLPSHHIQKIIIYHPVCRITIQYEDATRDSNQNGTTYFYYMDEFMTFFVKLSCSNVFIRYLNKYHMVLATTWYYFSKSTITFLFHTIKRKMVHSWK
jgi:YHS domain-containing protein